MLATEHPTTSRCTKSTSRRAKPRLRLIMGGPAATAATMDDRASIAARLEELTHMILARRRREQFQAIAGGKAATEAQQVTI